jgi:viroplasmin and RNaseH domain-containing protein
LIRKEKNMAKYYAVRVGARTGVFMSWEECQKAVNGFPNAKFKKFRSLEEAERFVSGDEQPIKEDLADGYVNAYVDGSYDSSTGRYSGAAVILLVDNDIIELSKACKDDSSKLRNVAGELLGAELAIEYCKEHGISKLAIHHDYEGIGAWADDVWKAKLPETKAYRNYVFDSREVLDIKFIKVKGHSGNEYNDRADYLASKTLSV